MPSDRPRDVTGLTAAQLERTRRDLEVSLALAFPGSPVRGTIQAEMTAIDAELASRAPEWYLEETDPEPHLRRIDRVEITGAAKIIRTR